MVRIISSNLLRECLGDKQKAKALALAFAVKAMFRSSRINNFTYSKLANMFGIGRERGKKITNILFEMNLCRRDGDHLTFTSLNREEYGNKNLEIQNYKDIDTTNLKEVEKFLRLQAIFFKQSQVEFAINTLGGIHNPRTIREYRSAKRRVNKLSCSCNREIDKGMAIKTICGTAGVGKNSAVHLIKWGESKKMLTKRTRRIRIGVCPQVVEYLNETKQYGMGTYFSYLGRVYLTQSMVLKFTHPDPMPPNKSLKA